MISCEIGKISINGNPAVICAELEDIISAVEKCFADSFESKEEARKMIDSIVANSRMSEEEKEAMIKEAKKNIPEDLVKDVKKMLLKELAEHLFGEEDEDK